jgi:NAD(P)-dependent dehydrogenase (short-subunit alcohol dehydrogenase family)
MFYKFGGFDTNYSLAGKTAFVTGAAIGIGKIIAELMSEKGAQLVLMDKSDSVHAVEKAIVAAGRRAISMQGDVTKMNEVESVIRKGMEAFGRIDVLVNNAAIVTIDDVEHTKIADWNRTLAVNLTAPFQISQAVGKEMIRDGKGGKIINIASQAAIIALPSQVAYCSSKAALVHMSKVMAAEWAKHNITVNCVSPTFVYTDTSWKKWAIDQSHELNEEGERLRKMVPRGRFVDPMEVAGIVIFFASDAANMITGANLIIDGGLTII